MMKSVIALGVLFAATLSLAAQRTVTTTTTTTTVSSHAATEWTASVGPSVSILPDSGETGIGTNFTFAGKVFETTPLYLGLDVGLTFWGNWLGGVDAARNPASKTGLAFLPMAYYEFNQGRLIRPYVGLSTGPYLNFGQLRTDAYFALFFKPGVNVAFNEKLGAGFESKFGSLAGTLIWAPQATINFAF